LPISRRWSAFAEDDPQRHQDSCPQRHQTIAAWLAFGFPPMQPGASFNLPEVKRKIEKAMANRAGQ